MNFNIRIAKPEDIRNIRLFYNTLVPEAEFTTFGKKLKPDWEAPVAKEIKSKNLTFFLAELNKKIIGIIILIPYRGDLVYRMRHVAVLDWAIAKTHRGKGVGSALAKEAIAYAKAHKITRLEGDLVPENRPSAALAKKFGFKLEGCKRKAFKSDNGKYHDLLVLGKLL